MPQDTDGQARGSATVLDLSELGELLEQAALRGAERALEMALEDATPIQEIPFNDDKGFTPAWAEGVLRELFTHHRDVFADCITGFLAEIRAAKRGRPAGKGLEHG